MQSSKKSVVIDTNVFVAALKNPEGTCARILESDIEILITIDILDEIKRTVAHPRLNISYRKQREILETLQERATVIVTVEIVNDCRDPDDNKFLECALAGNAKHIISGDEDLLALDPWRGIRILSPRAFLENYSKK